MGLDDPNSDTRYLPDELDTRWKDKILTVVIASGSPALSKRHSALTKALNNIW